MSQVDANTGECDQGSANGDKYVSESVRNVSVLARTSSFPRGFISPFMTIQRQEEKKRKTYQKCTVRSIFIFKNIYIYILQQYIVIVNSFHHNHVCILNVFDALLNLILAPWLGQIFYFFFYRLFQHFRHKMDRFQAKMSTLQQTAGQIHFLRSQIINLNQTLLPLFNLQLTDKLPSTPIPLW